jgi:hypothetical protein
MNVRFEGNNGHDADVTRCLLLTQSGHPIASLGSRREVGLAHRFLKLKLEPAPATVPAATEENQHYQDDDEEGGGVHVALPGASVPHGLHLFNVHWGVVALTSFVAERAGVSSNAADC